VTTIRRGNFAIFIHCYFSCSSKEEEGKKTIKIDGSKFVDGGGGFLLDERDLDENEGERAAKIAKLAEDEVADVPLAYQTCIECEEEYSDSFLFKNFGLSICEKCKTDENSLLITKTTARDEFLLKDCDFDKREPPLRYVSRKVRSCD
jgi:DNA-repair protein complementing XP-A cells